MILVQEVCVYNREDNPPEPKALAHRVWTSSPGRIDCRQSHSDCHGSLASGLKRVAIRAACCVSRLHGFRLRMRSRGL